MTQQHVARIAAMEIATAAEGVLRSVQSLEVVLGKAQNPPPEGEADGSIGIDEWNRMRALSHKAMEFVVATQLVRQ